MRSQLIKDFLLDYRISYSLKNLIVKTLTPYSHKRYPASPKERNKPFRSFHVVSKEPYIIFTSERLNEVELFSEKIADEKAYFFITFASSMLSDPHKITHFQFAYEKHVRMYPKHKLFFLCNTEVELKMIKKVTDDAYFISQNCYVDEREYSILDVPKEIDVIYNGRLNKSKRYHLLDSSLNVSSISANILNKQKDKKYFQELQQLLPDIDVLNFQPAKKLKDLDEEDYLDIPVLNAKQINKFINQSKVGVMLSAQEGANFAIMEYLLAGVPVVSSINIGGRDEFLKNEYCRIVISNKFAVKSAIEDVLAKDYAPEDVRKETLRVIMTHRQRLFALLDQVLKNEQINLSGETFFYKFFKDKIWGFKYFPEMYDEELKSAPELKSFE